MENLRTRTVAGMFSVLSRVCQYSEASSEGKMFGHNDKLDQFVDNYVVQIV